jgi:hypothetical protein
MQSGDVSLLLKENTYFKDPQAVRGEEKDTLWSAADGNHVKTVDGTEYSGSILEHMLIQNLTAFYDVGEHNHMRLRGADWNDALDMAKDRGESVAFTAVYGSNLTQMAELILTLDQMGTNKISLAKEVELLLSEGTELYNDIKKKQDLLTQYGISCKHTISGEKIEVSCKELASNLKKKADWIRNHIRETEWITDSEGHSWYNGYYDNSGRRVEGDHEAGVRMMLTGQVSKAEQAAVISRMNRRSGRLGHVFALSSTVRRVGRQVWTAVSRSSPAPIRPLAPLYTMRPQASRLSRAKPEASPISLAS